MVRTAFSILLAGLSTIFITACKKTFDKEIPNPGNQSDSTTYIQFTVDGVPLNGRQLYALVSVQTKTGQTTVNNKKVSINYLQGRYKTDKISLAKGEYRLSKFILLTASDTALYATPQGNSDKAAGVALPLPMAFTINMKGINDAFVEVLGITQNDSPDSYGYTYEDFGLQEFMNLHVKIKMEVGSVLYDSLPGKLIIDATNETGNHWIREIDLQRGLNEIRVPQTYSLYNFSSNKWNALLRQNYSRQQLQPNMLISLEGARQTKKLVEELSYIENVAGLLPDTRTEYYYKGSGLLDEVKFYQRRLQVSGLYLTFIHRFHYNGSAPDSISRMDPDNFSTGSTAFEYSDGKILNISNRSYDQETHAVFEYSSSGNLNIIEGNYLFSNGNSMTYTMRFQDGNRISDMTQSSTGGGESGNYEYDNNINPKHQMGYPDLYFTNYSKNNLMKEQKAYNGGYPSVIPYKFEYSYDNDGYPTELYVSYKGFTSQQHLYRIKKIYRYQ